MRVVNWTISYIDLNIRGGKCIKLIKDWGEIYLKKKEYLIFITPSIIVMIFLAIVPLGVTIFLSFTNFTFGGVPTFVGISNYIEILKSSRFWSSINFTLVVTVVTTLIKVIIGFVLAYLLYKVKSKVWKSILVAGFLIPFIVPPVVGTLVFSWLFRDNGGLYVYLFSLVGLDINFYASELGSQILVMIHWVWHGVAFTFIVLFAGLQSMSTEPLEASVMDGANSFQKIRYVVIPQLYSLFIFVFMIDIMDAYRMFDNIAAMTKGGPGSATETLMWYNYSVAMGELSLGKGSAISILTVFGILILLSPFLYQTYKEHIDEKPK